MNSDRWLASLCCVSLAAGLPHRPAVAQDTTRVTEAHDSVSFRFVDADLRAVIQAMGRYLDRPVLLGTIASNRVTFESPTPVPRANVKALLQGIAQANGLELVADSAFYRVGPRQDPVRPLGTPTPVGQAGPPAQLYVIRLKHAQASDVAGTVTALFGIAGSGYSGRTLSTGTLSDELRRNTAATSAAPSAGAGRAAAPGQSVGGAALGGAVTIVPEEMTNSLLIRASADDYSLIQRAVDQIDIRPLQVLIQVLIVEARRDRSLSLGADLNLPSQSLGSNTTLDGTSTGGGIADLVLHIMNLGPFDLEGTLRAAQTRGDVKIISRPVLLASNNTEAHFLVGSQRPFVQVSRSLPTETAQRDQVVQYKDVGTKLTVLPTINQDGYVSLMIQQEVNQATNETQFDAPIISTREAATRALVKDGQTIVLGGLRDQERDVSSSGIPILSGIPLIGGLFGASDHRTTETELFLFITPVILKTDADVDQATKAAQDSAARAGLNAKAKQ